MKTPPDYVPNEHTCPDGEPHVWGEIKLVVARSGPMEGDWYSVGCTRCNSGGLRQADGGDGFANLIAALEREGLEPRPVDGD